MSDPAAGPYGHPFHPILVTIPIGTWIGGFVLDIGARAAGNPVGLARGAQWMVGIGLAGALLAAVFGLMDLLTIPRGTRALRAGLAHMALNLTIVALFAVSFFIRLDRDIDAEPTNGLIVLSVVALALLSVSGVLGGRLAYHYGVRVADEATQAHGYR